MLGYVLNFITYFILVLVPQWRQKISQKGFFFFFCSSSEAYAIGKKEKPPFLPEEPSSSSEEDDPIPDELLCLICKDIMTDAVVIPCCGNSYCDECEFVSCPVSQCITWMDLGLCRAVFLN